MAAPEALSGERFAQALVRLSELGPPSELVEHAPTVAAELLGLDRVLLTRIEGGALWPESLHVAGPGVPAADLAALREPPLPIEYPLVEGEIMRRRRPQVVRRRTELDPPGRRAYVDAVGWEDYVAGPVTLDGHVIGFLHGATDDRPLGDEDADDLGVLCLCFALVYERAILRRRLRVQQQEMQRIASWATARTSDLSDRAITLQSDRGAEETASDARPDDSRLRDLLTRRELDVLELMVRGQTNAAIARELVVSQGTVKFHVKNILRKLHASNRADATSRYLRLTLGANGARPR